MPRHMTTNPSSSYVLGHTDSEHERLIHQARYLAPYTERFLRDAGIGPGQRVLDLGSGVGDVAMLVAKIVGPSGEVVGVERDPQAIAVARARVKEAGLQNVSFTQTDASQIHDSKLFDAAVGRYILMFLPDPVAVLRSLTKLVRPGGVVAFHEVSWAPGLALTAHLPLWSATYKLIHQTVRASGANAEMGPDLYHAFQKAGLPAPHMKLEIPLSADPDFMRMAAGLFFTLLPKMQELTFSLAYLGNLETLQQRLMAEAVGSGGVVPYMALVGAWSKQH